MFSLYNNLQNVAAAQAAHQAAQAVAANAGGVAPQPVPIPPPSNTVRGMTSADGNGVENAQNRYQKCTRNKKCGPQLHVFKVKK